MSQFKLYEEKGSGPALVFEHGTLMDASMFAPQMDYLAARGYRCIAQNSRVLAGTNVPHTLEDLADDTHALLDKLGLQRVVLVGMSVGGFMAIEFALKYPDRLNGLVLIDAKAKDYTPEEQVLFDAEFRKCDVEGPVPRFFAEWAAPFCFGPTTFAQNRALVDHWIDRWSTLVPARSVYNQGTSWIRKADRTPRLKEIKTPVLIIHGAEDVPVPLSMGISMLEHFPNAAMVKVPDVGHTSNLENPAVVNHAIFSFMENLHRR